MTGDARFSRTLVGSKPRRRPLVARSGWFQSNPCGVEASSSSVSRTLVCVFQSNPCGVEASSSSVSRTLVCVFQSNPCGVEASAADSVSDAGSTVSVEPLWGRSFAYLASAKPNSSFQSNPCGVEAVVSFGFEPLPSGFSRTLVGSKGPVLGVEDRPRGFSRTLVGSKRRYARAHLGGGPVSVEPLWGRSALPVPGEFEILGFQSNPCGVEAVFKRQHQRV